MQLTKNFNLIEFQCRDGSEIPEKLIPNIQKLAEQLQILRDEIGEPIHILSGYRTKAHNKAVGGAKNSMHLQGKAADIVCKVKTAEKIQIEIETLIENNEMGDGGVGKYATFTHYDIGRARRW